ncbi:hypothetical protein [Palleronia rufa]
MRSGSLNLLRVWVLSLSFAAPLPAHAVIDPGEPLKGLFSGFREEFEGVARAAESAGKEMIAELAKAVIAMIDAAEASAGDLVGQTFASLDSSLRDTFNEVDELATRLERGQEVLIEDATRLSAMMFDSAGSRVPLIVQEKFEVYTYKPRVIAPIGPTRIVVEAIGPGIGAARPEARINETDLEIEIPDRNTIRILLERDRFNFTRQPDRTATVVLTFDERPRTRFFRRDPNRITRQFSLWLLPTAVARLGLEQDILETEREWDVRRVRVNASGKDVLRGPYATLPDDDIAAGWDLDVETLGQAVRSGNGGKRFFGGFDEDSVDCVGPNMERTREHSVEFQIQLGSINGRGAGGSCWIALPMVRSSERESTISLIERPYLTWSDDRTLEVFEETIRWRLFLDFYDGTRRVLTNDAADPPMDISLERGDRQLVLRAVAPTDF